MVRWSSLTGAPRFGDPLPAHRLGRWKVSVHARVRAARRAAFVVSLIVLVALAGLVREGLAYLELDARTALLQIAVPLAVIAALFGLGRVLAARKTARPARTGAARAGFVATTVALAAGLGALLLDANAAVVVERLPAALVAERVPGLHPALVDAGVLLLAGILGGLHQHAIALGLGVGGTAPARASLLKAWRAKSSRDLAEPGAGGSSRYVTTAPSHVVAGLALPGLLVADLLVTVSTRLASRLSGKVVDRVHLDADLRTLAEALGARGFSVENKGRFLVVDLPRPAPTEVTMEPAEAGFRRIVGALAQSIAGVVGERKTERVRLQPRVIHLPPVESSIVVDLRGPPRAVRRLRRVIETEILFVGTFAWSLEARRIERRLNAIAAEAAYSGTAEERATLLEEAVALERVAHGRSLLEEEWALVAAWKAVRLRAILQDRILTAPPDQKREGRLVAPSATVPPNVEKLVAAGGLAAVRGVYYVPHFIVPVLTSFGEPELVVNGATGKVDRAESRVLLDVIRQRGTRFFVDGTKITQFVKRPSVGGTVYGEVRRVLRHEIGYWGPLHLDESLIETVLVPYVDADGKFVNAVTGKEAKDVRSAVADQLPLSMKAS